MTLPFYKTYVKHLYSKREFVTYTHRTLAEYISPQCGFTYDFRYTSKTVPRRKQINNFAFRFRARTKQIGTRKSDKWNVKKICNNGFRTKFSNHIRQTIRRNSKKNIAVFLRSQHCMRFTRETDKWKVKNHSGVHNDPFTSLNVNVDFRQQRIR